MSESNGIIIQARLGSTRMPGKVLEPFFGDLTILDILSRTAKSNVANLPVALATSTSPSDDPLAEWANRNSIACFRGSEQDVLGRFIAAAEQYGFTSVVRICADNPFLDLDLLNQLIAEGMKSEADYLSFLVDEHTPAIRSHWGIFAEWVKVSALVKCATLTDEAFFHEHVTNYVYGHPDAFKLHWLTAPPVVYGRSDIRFTIDTPADFSLMRDIYAILAKRGIPPNFKDAVEMVDKREEMKAIMKSQIDAFSK